MEWGPRRPGRRSGLSRRRCTRRRSSRARPAGIRVRSPSTVTSLVLHHARWIRERGTRRRERRGDADRRKREQLAGPEVRGAGARHQGVSRRVASPVFNNSRPDSIGRARIRQILDLQCGRRRQSAGPRVCSRIRDVDMRGIQRPPHDHVIAARSGCAPPPSVRTALDGRAVGAEPYKPSSGRVPNDGRLLQPCPGTSPGGQRVPSWRQDLPGSPPPVSPHRVGAPCS